MEIRPEISFQNVEHSDAVERAVQARIEELERFFQRIVACRVVVDAPHKNKRKGQIYEIRIDLSVPGKDIAVTREAGEDHAHEDIYVAIRDAFDAAQRLLEDYVRKMSSHRQKRHPAKSHGKVVRIFDDDGYGFIEAEEGHEVFFDRDSLTGQVWPRMKVGSCVRFTEREGDKGPYGANITLLD